MPVTATAAAGVSAGVTRTIDVEQARALLDAAVARRGPGHVFTTDNDPNGCAYTSPAGQHCLVGEALAAGGLPVPDQHNPINHRNVAALARWLRAIHDIQLTDEAELLLGYAQRSQDNETAWADAVAEADRRLSTDLDERDQQDW